MKQSISPRQHKLPSRTADLLIEDVCARARDRFASYRRVMHPGLIWNWWTAEVADRLNEFYNDLVAGRRPKLAIMAPPQHGKSLAVTDFITWLAGKNPNLKTIFASYSDELGVRTNLDVQRIIRSPRYEAAFGRTVIGVSGWQCNTNLIEFANYTGSFRNTTVMSGVTGFGLNLGVIDDPLKSRAEASSKLHRDRTWAWFLDEFFLRFAADAGMVIIMTRWHTDDLLGRALEKFGDFRVLKYPAIAGFSRDGRTPNWSDRRQIGECLFPEWKPEDFLLERRGALTDASWESLYQQEPYVVGGGQLPIDKLNALPYLDRSKILHSVRYWDKAGTNNNEDAAFTVGVLMHKLSDGTYVIEHVARGRWNALDREQRIKALAVADGKFCKNYEVVVEQEPGSGGKESAENTIRNLAGFRVSADKVTGSKEVRAEPFAAQVQGGNMWLVAGEWVTPFLDECESWPSGRFNDQIDAAAGAFNKLVASTSYNLDYRQWAY
jgi:predicted phage terminase large subunit-like protein